MATRQYIGARYVPFIDGDWSATRDYEPLTVILGPDGNSYTSKTFVPAGTLLSDTTYWVKTGNYNAQVEAYRQEVIAIDEKVTNLNVFNVKDYGAIGDGVHDDTGAINAAIAACNGQTLLFPKGEYLVSSTITIANENFHNVIFEDATLIAGASNMDVINIGSTTTILDTDNKIVQGALTVDCQNLIGVNGVVLDKGLYGGYVENILVRDVGSSGVGIYVGGKELNSRSFKMGILYVDGQGSQRDNIGIIVNNYDSQFDMINVSACQKGMIVNGSANTFNIVHIWAHLWDNFTKVNFEKTVGIEDNGFNNYNMLYPDSCYIGADMKKGGKIASFQYGCDLHENDIGLTDIYCMKVYRFRPVNIANYSFFGITPSVTFHDIEPSDFTGSELNVMGKWYRAPLIEYNVSGRRDILSELYLANNGLTPSTVCNYGALVASKYYLLGYIKCHGGSISLKIGGNYRATTILNIKTSTDGFDRITAIQDVTPAYKLYYGDAVTKEAAKFVPIYLKRNADGSDTISADVVSFMGEAGFYKDYVDSPNNLQYLSDGTGLTEIPTNVSRILRVNFMWSGTIAAGYNTLEGTPHVAIPTKALPLGVAAMNPINGYVRNWYMNNEKIVMNCTNTDNYTGTDIILATGSYYIPD